MLSMTLLIEHISWTTIITPRSMLIQKLGSFQDMDWSAPELTDNVLDDYTDGKYARNWPHIC